MRMTLSLTAILIEATGNISFALPLIVTFVCAKWTGDLFTEGIYDTQIAVSKVISIYIYIKNLKKSILKSLVIFGSTRYQCWGIV